MSKVGTFKLTIEYCGTHFSGWAVQPGRRTVEGELRAAIEAILGESVDVTVAGRTDAGVHAWGQVVSFEAKTTIDPQMLRRGLNAVLAPDVAVTRAEPAPVGFSARRDARSRTYCYRISATPHKSPFERDRALWWPHRCDVGRLKACAGLLKGTHQFRAFTPTQTDHVRFERDVLAAEWRGSSSAGIVQLWIEADSFMRHMVRVLVGTMLDVAGGRRDLESFSHLLGGAPRSEAGPTAPPHGLYLASVRY